MVNLFWVIALGLFSLWFTFWCVQGWRLSHRSGYYAPMITALPRYLRWSVGCLVAKVWVGKVEIRGWEHVVNCKGRKIVTPKHVNFKDAVLVAKLARSYKLRFLIAINQTKGVRAPPLAWMGAISVGYDKSNPAMAGLMAVRAAVNAMVRELDTILVIFPEGTLDNLNQLVRGRWRGGFARIARGVQKESSEQWFVIPADVQYPPEGGAIITFGAPIAVKDLPDDDRLATDYLFETMVRMRAGD